MCKILLRSDGQQRSYGKAKFPSNLNCGQKTVSETGPWAIANPDLYRHMVSLGHAELNVCVGNQHFSQINAMNKSDGDVAWPEMGHMHHVFV